MNTQHVIRFVTRVTYYGSNWLVLERPLPCNISGSWGAQVLKYEPSMQGAGVEELSIQFPVTPYPGHLKVGGGVGLCMAAARLSISIVFVWVGIGHLGQHQQ